MTATREEAAQKAEAARTNSPGSCQLWTRTLYGAPSAGDQDHDGDADAVDGWASEPRTARHAGDRNPPRGVPVAWDGGSHGYGHRAISLGGGKIRSTDAGGSGKVATVDLSWPEQHWGLHYLGWSETIDGKPIPDAAPAPKPDGLRVDLVDISHYQDGKIDYAAAKKAGVKGGYHKATEGTTFVDPNYAKRRTEFAAAGFPFGAYHFARPSSSSGAAQADHFLKVAGVKPGDLAPMLDLEDDGGLAKANLTSWVGAFVRRVHKATGVRPIIYTHFDLSDAHHCKLWVARYSNSNAAPVVPAPWSTWDVRQFSDGKYGKPSTVAGFGRVDLDMMRDGLTLADITVPANGGPFPTPAPPPKHSPHHARRVATLNVKSYPRMPIEYVNEDLARAAGEASLLLLQEIDPKFTDYTNAVRALPGFEADHLETEDVIAWRTSRWTRITGFKVMTHAGKAKVSPNRYVTCTVLEQADGAQIAALDTHAVSKPFWSRKRGLRPSSYLWRHRMWKLHMQKMADLVADLVDRQGLTVIIGGDFNHAIPKFHPDQVTIVEGTLDGLAYVPATTGARITIRSEVIVKDGWRTDHPMLKATLKVSA